jgi:hypothetical protein
MTSARKNQPTNPASTQNADAIIQHLFKTKDKQSLTLDQYLSLSKLYPDISFTIPQHLFTSQTKHKISHNIHNLVKSHHKKRDTKSKNSILYEQFMQSIQNSKHINRPFSNFPIYTHTQLKHLYDTQTYDNQKQFASLISNQYLNNPKLIHTLAVAPTQSGKTGSMLATIYQFINDTRLNLPLQNIFIFTAHSSKEWLIQTRQRFPEALHNNILHRNNYKQIIHKLHNLTNVLIIIDELQIAVSPYKTIHKLFTHIGIYDISHALRNNIKILSFTATPNFIPQHLQHWGPHSSTVFMNVPDNYISHSHLFKTNRLLQSKPLHSPTQSIDDTILPTDISDNIFQIFNHISYTKPVYHIIRTPRGSGHHKVINNFKIAIDHLKADPSIAPIFHSFIYNIHTEALLVSEPSRSSIQPNFLDQILSVSPKHHTFIFIMDKLRCAKTITHSNVGVLYDRYTPSTSIRLADSVVQGLAGRLTGYHSNTHSVCFTSIHHIQYYLATLQSNFSPDISAFNPLTRRYIRAIPHTAFYF